MDSNNDITTFDGNGNAIWNYGTGFIKAYTEDYETKKRLERVSSSQLMCTYLFPKSKVTSNGRGRKRRTAWDFVIPVSRRKTVEKILKG